VLSGQEIRRMVAPQGTVSALAFAPDSRTLASGGTDSTILLWGLTGPAQAGQAKPVPPTAAQLAGLWSDLAGAAAPAEQALWALARAPEQSVPFLKGRLLVAPAAPEQVAKLIADLDSGSFAVRQKAAQALAELGEAAEGAVRQTLKGKLTLEVRRRLEQILEQRDRELLRKLRAMEALEHIGTAEARQVLKALADAAPDPRVAQAAGAALQRLAR
jgi:hypothetical protein